MDASDHTAPHRTGVVIATRNRSELLDRTLERLGALPDGCDVVVADNASTDGTAQIVRERNPHVTVV